MQKRSQINIIYALCRNQNGGKYFHSDEDFSSKSSLQSHESRYMLRILAGSSKDLCVKVHKTCGIKISEDDMSSKVLCRGCVSFVNKMELFIQRAQFIENTPSDQSSECAVKRYVQLSPSSLQPSKC